MIAGRDVAGVDPLHTALPQGFQLLEAVDVMRHELAVDLDGAIEQQEALEAAGCTLADVDGIAVTCGPGLVGSLLVGINFAKALALGADAIAAGAAGGFTSFIAHAGGPPISIYLLRRPLDRTDFVATTVLLFAAINYVKLLPYGWLGQLSAENLATSLVLAPLAPVGVDLDDVEGGMSAPDPTAALALAVHAILDFSAIPFLQELAEAVDLEGVRVAVQGCGTVGAAVARAASALGAHVLVADIDDAAADALGSEVSASVVDADRILQVDADILAPCAVGGVLSEEVARTTPVWAVCGAANNILASPAVEGTLARRGILWVPDPLSSAGAVIEERLRLERNLAFLGTVGNNAPFIGLFGTVLGIIRAFADLAAAGR